MKILLLNAKKSGFSLIELIVSLSIIILISTLMFVNYPDLSEKYSIDRAARLVSLSIRDAQVKAMAIKEDSQNQFPAYGAHFNKGNKKLILIFSDSVTSGNTCKVAVPENCWYESGIDSIVESRAFPTTATISNLCGNLKSNPPSGNKKECNLQSITATFLRPTPTTFLKAIDSKGNNRDFQDIEIVLDLPSKTRNQQKIIGITESGQIFIEDSREVNYDKIKGE